MNAVLLLAVIASSYLLGSIPTSYIFGKLFKGVDIREHGSGNVGATNVYRVVGKLPGFIVLALDLAKGLIPVTLFSGFLLNRGAGFDRETIQVFLGASVIAGHIWTIFLRFKGGKGVATAAGVVLGIEPKFLILALLIWIIVFVIIRYVSTSSICSALSIPVIFALSGASSKLVIFTAVISFIIIYRHRPNIERLIRGEEKKIF